MSKKSQRKRPRQMFVGISVLPGSEVKLIWDKSAQTISYKVSRDGKTTRPVYTNVGLTYEGENGKPQLLAMTSSANRPAMLDFNEFLSTFSDAFVIDTSYDDTIKNDDDDKHQICAACVLHFNIQKEPDGQVLLVDPILRGMEFWNPRSADGSRCDPEKFAWRHLIQMIQKSVNYSDNSSYALIVDPHVQHHQEYNLGHLPLVDDFYLPKNFELVYARAKGASDTLLNKFFVGVDKRSHELRELALRGEIDMLNYKILTVPGCTFFRFCQGFVEIELEEEQKQKQPRKK